MANISNFVINGASYSYDTEARNPLSPTTTRLAVEGKLMYGTDESGVTAVDTGSDDKVKTPAEIAGVVTSVSEPSEPEVKTATLFVNTGCSVRTAKIKYKGVLVSNDLYMLRVGFTNSGIYSVDYAELEDGSTVEFSGSFVGGYTPHFELISGESDDPYFDGITYGSSRE